MEPTTSDSISSVKKRLKRSAKCKDEDRLSNLPSALLHYVLSFLDMKYVVKTCVLSRRWRDVWMSVPNLNFDYQFHSKSGGKGDEFVDFVDQVLLLRSTDSNIQELSLRVRDIENVSLMNTWIRFAVKHNVQVLDVNITRQVVRRQELPLHVSGLESLRVLKLTHDFFSPTVDLTLPHSVSLPRLKVLQLSAIRFSNEKLMAELLSNCPVLETLVLKRCGFWNMKNVVISGRQLKNLVIEHCRNEYHSSDLNVMVSASSLESFSCKDLERNEFSLAKFPSLVDADIDIAIQNIEADSSYDIDDYCRMKDRFGYRMVNIFNGLSCVRVLTLSAWSVQFLSEVLNTVEDLLNTFHNLRYLKVTAFCTSSSIRSVIRLLKSLPNLETFKMRINERCCKEVRYYICPMKKLRSKHHNKLLEEELLSLSVLRQLKSIEIRELLGCKDEINFVKFVLKNAVKLEKLVIIVADRLIKEAWTKDFHDRLLKFPRASPSISVFLSFEEIRKPQSNLIY
ncbi:hypothetical protein ACHQM5_002915 [Ranunculus cassubicifolius]